MARLHKSLVSYHLEQALMILYVSLLVTVNDTQAHVSGIGFYISDKPQLKVTTARQDRLIVRAHFRLLSSVSVTNQYFIV